MKNSVTISLVTGYFARPTEKGHHAKHTKVHLVNGNIALCGYMPHPSMKLQGCANFAHLPYVECDRCREKYLAAKGKSVELMASDLKVLKEIKDKLLSPENINAVESMISRMELEVKATFPGKNNRIRL